MGSGDFPNQWFQVLLVRSDSQDPSFCLYGDRFLKLREHFSAFCGWKHSRNQKQQQTQRKPPMMVVDFVFFSRRKTKGEIFLTKNRYRIFNQPGTETIRASGRQPTEQTYLAENRWKTRWSTRLCLFSSYFSSPFFTANTGYIYNIDISLAKHLIPRKIRCFCFIYHVYRYSNTYFYILT